MSNIVIPAELLFETLLGVRDRTHISKEFYDYIAPHLAGDQRYHVSPPNYFDAPDYIRVNYILWRHADWEVCYERRMKAKRDNAEFHAAWDAESILVDCITKALKTHKFFASADAKPFLKLIVDKKMQSFILPPPIDLNIDLTAAWQEYEREIQIARESIRG